MTTDKTPATLATVKHGGCVQLASLTDQKTAWMLPDDARIVGVIADNIERGKLDHPGFYRNTQLAEALRRVLDAALSAQPSPGGQGAPMNLEDKAVRQFLADRAPTDVHREEILSGAYDHTLWFDHIRELMTTLAARQPVKAMSAEASRVARGMVMHCIEHRLCMGMDEGFASFDPDMEHPFVQELREFAEGARHPVGEPVLWVSPEVLDAMAIHRAQDFPAGGMGLACPAGSATVPLYAAPPAQAVDLGPVRVLADKWARIGSEDARFCASELLALIDSQAVGK